jgi:CheY-like chemotaxis protein
MTPHREGLAGLRVLVAEDEVLILMEIEEMLRELGCEIVGPAATVEAAVAAVRGHHLDGALLDLNLHGESVLPAAEELASRSVPFLLVTGYPSRAGDAQALRDAPRLKKPFSLQSLTDAMTAAFVAGDRRLADDRRRTGGKGGASPASA